MLGLQHLVVVEQPAVMSTEWTNRLWLESVVSAAGFTFQSSLYSSLQAMSCYVTNDHSGPWSWSSTLVCAVPLCQCTYLKAHLTLHTNVLTCIGTILLVHAPL